MPQGAFYLHVLTESIGESWRPYSNPLTEKDASNFSLTQFLQIPPIFLPTQLFTYFLSLYISKTKIREDNKKNQNKQEKDK